MLASYKLPEEAVGVPEEEAGDLAEAEVLAVAGE